MQKIRIIPVIPGKRDRMVVKCSGMLSGRSEPKYLPRMDFGFNMNEHGSFIDVCDNAFASKHYHCTEKPKTAGRRSFAADAPQDDRNTQIDAGFQMIAGI